MDLTKYEEIEYCLKRANKLVCAEIKNNIDEDMNKSCHLIEAYQSILTAMRANYCAKEGYFYKTYKKD